MVLNAVDQRLRMLHAYTQCKGFGLDADIAPVQQAINIAGGVARSQNSRVGKMLVIRGQFSGGRGGYAHNPAFFHDKISYILPKMHFAAILNNGLAEVLHHTGQFIGANMRMRFHQNIAFGAVFHQQAQGLLNAAAFGRTGV